jgi:hypothetical protein
MLEVHFYYNSQETLVLLDNDSSGFTTISKK